MNNRKTVYKDIACDTAAEFLTALQEFLTEALLEGVSPQEVEVEYEEYSVTLYFSHPKTEEELALEKEKLTILQQREEARDRKLYEELKERFG